MHFDDGAKEEKSNAAVQSQARVNFTIQSLSAFLLLLELASCLFNLSGYFILQVVDPSAPYHHVVHAFFINSPAQYSSLDIPDHERANSPCRLRECVCEDRPIQIIAVASVFQRRREGTV